MLIQSSQLGDIEVGDDEIISFPQGLPGFPEEKAFAFLPYQVDSPFGYLQSVATAKLTFLVVNPFAFFADYEFELSDDTLEEMTLTQSNLPQIINIVSVPDKTENMTMNLLAPVIINTQTNKAVQVILKNTAYTTRHRLFADGLPKQPSTEGK